MKHTLGVTEIHAGACGNILQRCSPLSSRIEAQMSASRAAYSGAIVTGPQCTLFL